MGSSATIGDVTARLTADTASFDSSVARSGEVITRHAELTEKAAARARAAWEKELLAQDKAARSLEAASRAKELAALKSDILTRSLEAEAAAQVVAGEAAERSGHAAVSSVQAASASIRLVEGGMTNNIRAVERFLSMLPGVGAALKVAFPVVGALAFAGLVAEIGEKAYKAIQQARGMADVIRKGFDELHSSSQTANDALAITNDDLDRQLAKLEKKPSNGLQLALDEDRQSADKLADSLGKAIDKVTELITKNKVGVLGQLMGQAGTKDAAEIVNDIQSKIDAVKNSYQETIDHAIDRGATHQNIVDIKTSELAELEKVYADGTARIKPILHEYQQSLDMFQTSNGGRGRDERGNVAILGGYMQVMEDQQREIGQSYREDDLRGQIAPLKDTKENSDAAKAAQSAAMEAKRKAAQEQMEGFNQRLANIRQNHQLQIGEEEMFWRAMRSQTEVGGLAWNAINEKIGAAHQETMKQFAARSKEMAAGAGQIGEVQARIAGMMQRDASKDSDAQQQDYADSNKLAIIQAHNQAREEEAQIMERAGQTMTQYAAAVQLAAIHEKEFAAQLFALESIRRTAEGRAASEPTKENKRAAAEANDNIVNLQSSRSVQMQQDQDAIYGPSTLGSVGASDALNDFVRASRDAASQMRDLTANILGGLNQQIVGAMSGQRTNFGNFGAGVFRGVAGIGLERAEGTVLSGLGFGGKMGTQANPMWTISADAKSAASTASGLFGKMFSGGGRSSSSGLRNAQAIANGAMDNDQDSGAFDAGSILKTMIPFMASGGPISANTMAMVGERGPELFVPSASGSIIPNHQLGSVGGGGDTHAHYWDLRGASDPAQMRAIVMDGFKQHGPSLVAASVRAVREDGRRRPTSYRS